MRNWRSRGTSGSIPHQQSLWMRRKQRGEKAGGRGFHLSLSTCHIDLSSQVEMAAYGVLAPWLKGWLVCSTLICSIDVAFTVLRPESLHDGKYGSYFSLWHIYADVDTRYANQSDPVTRVTGPLMCVELLLNVAALFMDLFHSGHALLAALTSSAFAFWKTAVYLCLFIPAKDSDRHISVDTPPWKEVLVFWVPNSVWLFFPLSAIVSLWAELVRGWIPPQERDQYPQNLHKFLMCRRESKWYRNANAKLELCAADEIMDLDEQETGRNWRQRALMDRLKIFNKHKSGQ